MSSSAGISRPAGTRASAFSYGHAPSHSEDSNHGKETFGSRVMAPATQWYQEMRWNRDRNKKTGQRWVLVVSYAPDWILTILTAGLLQLIDKVYGFRREFSLTDTSIQHSHALHERISVGFLAVLAFVIPVAIMAVISLGISRSVWDFHACFLGIVVSHALTLAATTIIKVCVGRPRPDLIDRCQPRQGSQNASPFGLATERVCTTDPNSHLLSDGFRSFPSGHSSTAFAGLTFLSLWLGGKCHIWQKGRGSAAGAWLMFIPMFGATMIAISRTMDYRHHATDVIAGSILGFVIAVSIYHNYYPPLWHTDSQKPWSPRNSVAHRWLLHRSDHGDVVSHTGTSQFAQADEAEHVSHRLDDIEAMHTNYPDNVAPTTRTYGHHDHSAESQLAQSQPSR